MRTREIQSITEWQSIHELVPRPNLRNIRDPVVVVIFWADWCGYCNQFFKWLVDRKKDRVEKGITYVTIDLSEVAETTKTGESTPAGSSRPSERASVFQSLQLMQSLASLNLQGTRRPQIVNKLPGVLIFDSRRVLRCRFSGVSEERYRKLESCLSYLGRLSTTEPRKAGS